MRALVESSRQRAAPGGSAAGAALTPSTRGPAAWIKDFAGLGEGPAPGRVTVHTLTLTRWIAVVGQLFSILFVHTSLAIPLPLGGLLPAVALSALLNLVLLLRLRGTVRLPELAAVALYAYDILQLCYLLALTGGTQNPFAVLLLVPVALAAASLELRSLVAVAGLALACLAALTLWSGGLPWHDGPLALPLLYRVGAAAGLVIATVLIAVFVWGLAEAARRRADALHVTQLALAREQQLSAVGGQAAAAAHLLGTPLGTITIIARELVRELPPGAPLAEDAAELLAQAQRCREILKTLGRPEEERDHARFTAVPLSVHLEQVAAGLARPGIAFAVRVEPAADGTPEPPVAMTPEFRHSLGNLIDNAFQFAESRVDLTVRPGRSGLSLAIEDDGPGFPPEVLDWVGEPFLASRREGGMGLGIFIAVTLLARNGARAHFDNTARGARVTVAWPPDAFRPGREGAET